MRIAPLVCLLSALVSSACSKAHEGSPGFQRIELAPAGSPPDLAAEQVVASFGVDDETVRFEPIAPTNAQRVIVADENGEECAGLDLGAGEFRRIEVQGSFDPRSFDRVRVVSITERRVSVRVSLGRRGVEPVEARSARMPGHESAAAADFEFPDLWRETKPYDSLRILFRTNPGRVCLVRVELVRVTPEAKFPDPAGPAELVCIGEQWRRARLVSPRLPLEATFDVPAATSLVFSYGLPGEARDRKANPRLRVEIDGEGARSIERELVLESDVDVDAIWHEASIPLDSFAGRRVHARFSAAGSPPGLFVVGEPALVARSRAAPTVVLVTSDTHRGDHLGLAKDGVGVVTPFLDALAARGVLFEDCWTSANSTQPSHAALLTGCTPRDTGVVSNEQRLADAAPTLAEVFREAGYLTWSAVSVGHLGPRMSGLGQGFDRVSAPSNGQRDSRETIAELSSWLPEADGVPLFLWLHVFDAHSPYEVPEAYERLYYPASRDPRSADLPLLRGRRKPYWDETIRDVEWVHAQYKSQITYLDERLGELFAHPRLCDAIVAVTADHGESLGAHGVHYSHAELYPDTLHVPLVLAWPGAPPGTRVEQAVNQIDVGRTLLDLAGLEDRPFPGRDLARQTAEPLTEPRFALAVEAFSASVQVGRWLLVMNLVHRARSLAERGRLHAIELFDLSSDPECERDLSSTETEQARKLRSLLVEWLAAAPAESWRDARVALDEELAELAELGYASEGSEERSDGWVDPECVCENCAAFE